MGAFTFVLHNHMKFVDSCQIHLCNNAIGTSLQHFRRLHCMFRPKLGHPQTNLVSRIVGFHISARFFLNELYLYMSEAN